MTPATIRLTITLFQPLLLLLCPTVLCDRLVKPGKDYRSSWIQHHVGEVEDLWLFHSEGKKSNFIKSKQICQSMGGNLVTFKTDNKSRALQNWLEKDPNDSYNSSIWLGLWTLKDGGSKWADGTYLGDNDYRKFVGDPMVGCYQIIWANQGPIWKHRHCGDEMPFLCESKEPCSPKPVFFHKKTMEWREKTTASIVMTEKDYFSCMAVGDHKQVTEVILQCDGLDGQKSGPVSARITLTNEFNGKYCLCTVRLKESCGELVLRIVFPIQAAGNHDCQTVDNTSTGGNHDSQTVDNTSTDASLNTSKPDKEITERRTAWAHQKSFDGKDDPWLYILIASGLFFAITLLVFVVVFGKEALTWDEQEQSLDKSEASSRDESTQSKVSDVETQWRHPTSEEEENETTPGF